jgi:tetratricopeptide (TPR) repeat protein
LEKGKEGVMRYIAWMTLVVLLGAFVFAPSAGAGDKLARAERAEAEGGLDNLEQAVRLYEQVAENSPQSYVARWKGARVCRKVAEQAKLRKVEDWKDVCAEYGKKGMELAQQAVELRPDGVEGHYYYGICVGSYSDGVNIFTALGEGLKGKTRKHLKKAYKLNKRFNDATPVMALGRFYEVLPWLAGQDKDQALQYYQEALRLMPEESSHRPKLHVFAGRLMLDMGKQEKRARRLLREAANSEDSHYSERAREVLQEYS